MERRILIRIIASLIIISIVGNSIVVADSGAGVKLPSVADVYHHLGKGEDYVAEECLIVNSVSNELNGHMLSVLELENGDCIIFELYNGLLVVEAIIDNGGIYTEIDYSKSGRLKTIDYSVSSADNARKKQKTDEQLRDTGTEGYIYFYPLLSDILTAPSKELSVRWLLIRKLYIIGTIITFASIFLILIPGLGAIAVFVGVIIMLVAGILDLIAMYKSSVACKNYDNNQSI